MPVYSKLAYYVFNSFNKTENAENLSRVELINTMYSILNGNASELGEIYSYMLQHGLYDVEEANTNRFGSFASYLDAYNAPFLFLSTDGKITDYLSAFHEFGHFSDFYVNDNDYTSIDLSEVSSQALELLSLTWLDSVLDGEDITYLTYYEMQNALLTLISNGFYATFEHIAYNLEYDEITEDTLSNAVKEAAKTKKAEPQKKETSGKKSTLVKKTTKGNRKK